MVDTVLSERFLTLYDEELRYLREAGKLFAQAHPQVAQHLGVHTDGILDPFVERLLEGTAFLSTRIQERLNNEQPEFALQMLVRLAPLWYTPVPSIATVAITPDLTSPQWQSQVVLPRGSKVLLQDASLGNKPATFTTARPMTIQPLEIERAECSVSAPSHLPETVAMALHDGLAHISLHLTTRGVLPLSELTLDPLSLTMAGDTVRANQLLSTLLHNSLRVVLWAKTSNQPIFTVLDKSQLRLAGISDDEALLPVAVGELPGSRLIREYFAAPFRFFTLELHGIDDFLQRCEHRHDFEVLFVLNQRPLLLIDQVSRSDFRLFATPVINLYRRRCNPVVVNHERTENHLVVDRLNPSLYEIHHVTSVTGLLTEGGTVPFSSLHGDALYGHHDEQAGYAIRRRSDPGIKKYRNPHLPGDDLFISLSPGNSGIDIDRIKSLVIDAMVCERHLIPSHLQQPKFQLENALPVSHLETLRHPTNPQGVPGVETAWQALQLLANNPLRYAKPDVDDCSPLLRDWLTLFCPVDDASQRKRIASISHASISHCFERYQGAGPIAWVRGAEMMLDLRSSHHSDQGIYLFGKMLHHALKQYCELDQPLRLRLCIDGETYAEWGAPLYG